MMRQFFSGEEAPEFHPSMVAVKFRLTEEFSAVLRSGTQSSAGASAEGRMLTLAEPMELVNLLNSDFLPGPGMSALEALNRNGLIESIVPLARQPDVPDFSIVRNRPGAAMAYLAGSTSANRETQAARQIENGVSFVRLAKDASVDRLYKELQADPNIESVSRVPTRYLCLPARATRAAPPQSSYMHWNLPRIRWEQARALPDFKEPKRIRVAVLDSGIEESHPDLKGSVRHYEWFPDVPTISSAEDIIGHGTHVAGTIAANIRNAIGIRGLCQCDLRVWKIFDDVALLNPARGEYVHYVNPIMYLRALIDCLDQGVDVVNLSIGGPGRPSSEEAQAFNALIANGTTVVAAMGNERRQGSPISYPAAIDGVIAVGATRPDDRVASFSNRGSHISLSAPGVAIWSTLPTYPGNSGYEAVKGPGGSVRQGKPIYRETHYDAWDGTSMATPHVAGAVAMLLGTRGPKSVSEVERALIAGADKVPDMNGRSFDHDFGHGRLNLENILR